MKRNSSASHFIRATVPRKQQVDIRNAWASWFSFSPFLFNCGIQELTNEANTNNFYHPYSILVPLKYSSFLNDKKAQKLEKYSTKNTPNNMEGYKEKNERVPSPVSKGSHHQVLCTSFQKLVIQVYTYPFGFYYTLME